MNSKTKIANKLMILAPLSVIAIVAAAIFSVYSLSQGINGILGVYLTPPTITAISFKSSDWINILNSVSSKSNLNLQVDYNGTYSGNSVVTWHPNATCSGTGASLRNYCLLGRCRFSVNLEPDKLGLMQMSVKVTQNGETKCTTSGVWLKENISSPQLLKVAAEVSVNISKDELLQACNEKKILLYFDSNQDCKIDAGDIQAVTNAVLKGGSPAYCFDINKDGRIDAVDNQTVINTSLGTTPIKQCEIKLNYSNTTIDSSNYMDDSYYETPECEVPSPGSIDTNKLSFYIPDNNRPFSYCAFWVYTVNSYSNNPLVYPNKYLFNNSLDIYQAKQGVNFKLSKIKYDLWLASPAYWSTIVKEEDMAYRIYINNGFNLGTYATANGKLQKSLNTYTACGYPLFPDGTPNILKRTSISYNAYYLSDTKDVSYLFTTNYIPALREYFLKIEEPGGNESVKIFQGQYGLNSTVIFNPYPWK